jgi:hypothetical protein
MRSYEHGRDSVIAARTDTELFQKRYIIRLQGNTRFQPRCHNARQAGQNFVYVYSLNDGEALSTGVIRSQKRASASQVEMITNQHRSVQWKLYSPIHNNDSGRNFVGSYQ